MQVILELELLASIGRDGQEYEPEASRFPPKIYLAVTDATMGTADRPGWVADTLKYLGFQGDFANLERDVKDKEVEVYCKYESNQKGQQVEKWNVSRPRTAKPAARQEVRKLNTQFAGLFKGMRCPRPPPSPRPTARPTGRSRPAPRNEEPQPQESGPNPADDIPF